MTVLIGSPDSWLSERWEQAVSSNGKVQQFRSLEALEQEYYRLEESEGCLLLVDERLMGSANHLSKLLKSTSHAKAIILSLQPDDYQGIHFIAAGAGSYCNGAIQLELLSAVVEIVLNGGIWLPPNLMKKVVGNIHLDPQSPPQQLTDRLSPRELQIAERVSTGESNKEVARVLDISDKTVKIHLSSIYRKIGVKSRLDLALYFRNRS